MTGFIHTKFCDGPLVVLEDMVLQEYSDFRDRKDGRRVKLMPTSTSCKETYIMWSPLMSYKLIQQRKAESNSLQIGINSTSIKSIRKANLFSKFIGPKLRFSNSSFQTLEPGQ